MFVDLEAFSGEYLSLSVGCFELMVLFYEFSVIHVSVSLGYSELMLRVELVCRVHISVSLNFSEVVPSVPGGLFCSVLFHIRSQLKVGGIKASVWMVLQLRIGDLGSRLCI